MYGADNMNHGQFDQHSAQGNNMYSKSDFPQFDRPMGLRWRDDARMRQMFSQEQQQQQQEVQMMPVLTEHQRPFQLPSTSNHHATTSSGYGSPSLEDMDLIDNLWRSDIAREKGAPTVEPEDQCHWDLTILTEKSALGPLSAAENDMYENLSKNLYEDFYRQSNYYPKAHQERMKSPTPEQHTPIDDSEDDLPTEEDLEELLKDVSREESELNKVFENKNPVLNNVSLSDGIVYTHANLTEMQEIQESCNQINLTASSVVSSSQSVSLFNETDAQTREQWQQAEMVHTDLFPPSNYVYIGMQNDTPQAVISNGQISYDHSYASAATAAQTPLSPLNIGRSNQNVGRQQQTQTSPGSATVTATATQSLFEPSYHMQRNSFSDCTTDSSSPCSRLSSESPRYTSESSTGTHESRFYGKLVPSRGSRFERPSPSRSPHSSSIKINRVLSNGQRKRGRQSKDEQLAAEHSLPVTAHQISEMSLSELQNVLKDESLSEYQRQLIRKIRRRGKNKVAARTCRQRRTDRHDKVTTMHYI